MGEIKKKKQREKEREVYKVSCSLPGRGILVSPFQESQLWPQGLVLQWASWFLSTPSGQDASHS